ncbi:unnamed protein product, partial [Ilex paraguariensis]
SSISFRAFLSHILASERSSSMVSYAASSMFLEEPAFVRDDVAITCEELCPNSIS